MQIQITKRPDGAGLLNCIRDDGSSTWQKQTDRHAAYFALHDLTHFALETTLGYKRGFFGLIAEGWDIEDTTGLGARGPLPAEAAEVECIVSLFFSEQASHALWTAEEFNYALTTYYAANNVPRPSRHLTDDEIMAVRKRRAELYAQWEKVPVGQKLELSF